MKKYLKRIVALICVLTLCVGTIHITTKAVDSYTGKLTIAGSLTTSDSPAAFYIKGTDDYVVGKEWGDITMMPAADDTASGVFINGNRINTYYSAGSNPNSVRLRKIYDSSKQYYIEKISNVETGDVLTIKGTFYVDDGWLDASVNYDSTPIVFEASHFLWNGSQWIDCYSGSLKFSSADGSNAFYMTGTDEYTVGKEWADITMMPTTDDTSSGIFINGIRIDTYYSAGSNPSSVRLRKTIDSSKQYYINNIPDAETGDVLTIKGTFYVDDAWLDASVNYDSTPIVFLESSFQYNGSQWVDYVEPTQYTGKLTIEGAQASSTNLGAMYLKGTDAYLPNDSSAWDETGEDIAPLASDTESGVFLNGTRLTSNVLPDKTSGVRLRKYWGSSNYYYIERLSASKTGDVITIKGTFYSEDGLSAVTFEESKFQWNGNQWVDYVEVAKYTGKLTVEGAQASSTSLGAMYLKGTDTYLPSDSSAWDETGEDIAPLASDTESGVFLNGTRLTSNVLPDKTSGVRLRKYWGSSNYYYIERLSASKTGDVITIKGTFYSEDGLSAVTFEESKFQWNGSQWVDYVEITKYSGTLTTEGAEAVSSKGSQLYLKGTDGYLAGVNNGWNTAYLTADSADANSGVWLGGTKVTEAKLQKYNGASNYYFMDNFGTANIGDIVTIKGTFYSADGLSAITFEEVKLQYEGNCWINLSTMTSYEEGTIWLDTNSTNTATNLNLRGSVDIHEDCSPEDDTDFGWTTTVGTTGFYKNDVACAGTLKNVANGGGWYLGLEDAGITEGDKLTIRGTYGYNGRYVKFAEYNLWYTNGSWVTTAPITSDTQICGDANGDGELNSLDIARLKKHLADEPVSVYKTGADANGVDGVNDRDRIKIYEYILEGAVRKVDGSYVVQYYPVYLDDEDISLGAYHGPRMSGKQDYTYSNGTLSSTTVSTNFLNAAEFAKYKAAGLNTLLHEVDGPYSSKTAGLGYGVDDGNFQNYLRLAKEADLDVYITSMGLNSYVKYEGAGDGATSIDFNGDGTVSTDTITIDETKYGWDYNGDGTISSSAQMTEIFYYSDSIKNASGMTILEADIRELFDYIVNNGYEDIFKGLAMPDEPWLTGQTRYQSAVTLINKLAAEYGLDIDYQGCVYPSYADSTQIGDTYTTYINGFGTAAGSLMYDFYPLQNTKKWYQSSPTNTLNAAWLTNLQTVATEGKNNNYTAGITLQSCGYEYAADSGLFANESYRRDPSSDADMQFQVYSALAFGMKKINYFTYWEHPNQSQSGEQFTSSMVQYPASGGTESVTTDIYTYVQNANAEITKFDHVFMDYDWVETKTNGSSDLFSGLTSTNISGVTVNSYSNASIISHMYDSEKQLDGYWLVNVAEPSGSTTATLNVTFTGKNKAIVYINGEEQIVDLTNGVYEASLAVGEGIFIIPLSISE